MAVTYPTFLKARAYARLREVLRPALARRRKFNPNHDERGRFAESPGSGATPSARPSAQPSYTAQPVTSLAQVHAPLTAIGMNVLTVDQLEPAIRARMIDIKDPTTLTTDHILAAQGMADAVLDARQDSRPLNLIRQATLRTPIVFADYEPKEAMMTTVVNTKSGLATMLLNTNIHPSTDLLTLPDRSTVASQRAKEIAKTNGIEAGVRALYHDAMWHEMGHVADGVSGGLLTTQVEMAILASAKAFTVLDEKKADRMVRGWIKKHLTLYAQHSARESAAEVFNMIQRRLPLPGLLPHVERGLTEHG